MRRINLFCGVLLLCLCWGCSSTYVESVGGIKGKIVDAHTGEPLAVAEVILSPSNRSTVTGSDGNYLFSNLQAGDYVLTIKSLDYVTSSRTLRVVPGDVIPMDVTLERAAVNTKLSLSDNVLDFGSSATTLSFRIENVGNGGYIDWTISDGGKGWMDIRPKMGRLDEGKSCVVSVTVDRSKMLQSDNGLIVVSGGGESADVMVYASVGKAQDAIMGVSVSMLRFVEGVDELSFRIDNLSPGILSWQMDELNDLWLTASPMSGNIRSGGSQIIDVGVFRSGISNSGVSRLVIRSGEECRVVHIVVDNTEDGSWEDYSGVIIEQCDERVRADLISCKRAGTSVKIEFGIKNVSLGVCNDFRVFSTSKSGIPANCFSSLIVDSDEMSYPGAMLTFAGVSVGNTNHWSGSLDEGVYNYGYFLIDNVGSNVSSFERVVIGVLAYPDVNYGLISKRIIINNVPIY